MINLVRFLPLKQFRSDDKTSYYINDIRQLIHNSEVYFKAINQQQFNLDDLLIMMVAKQGNFDSGICSIKSDLKFSFTLDTAHRYIPNQFNCIYLHFDEALFLSDIDILKAFATKIKWVDKGVTLRFYYGVQYSDMDLSKYITLSLVTRYGKR